jgi:hypothetical protein
MSNPVRIRIQDHSFVIADAGADMPFETMDYSTGLAGSMASSMLVYAGIDRGTVHITAQAVDQPPALDTPEQWNQLAEWEDVAEISLHVPQGALTVELLETAPTDSRPDLPSLSPHGPGDYRLRLHARGRDRHYDKLTADSGEHFHIIAWPAPVMPPLAIKSTSQCSYGLRMSVPGTPPRRIEPLPVDLERQREADHQAMLHRALQEE